MITSERFHTGPGTDKMRIASFHKFVTREILGCISARITVMILGKLPTWRVY